MMNKVNTNKSIKHTKDLYLKWRLYLLSGNTFNSGIDVYGYFLQLYELTIFMLREHFSIKALTKEFYPFREEKYFHHDLHK